MHGFSVFNVFIQSLKISILFSPALSLSMPETFIVLKMFSLVPPPAASYPEGPVAWSASVLSNVPLKISKDLPMG